LAGLNKLASAGTYELLYREFQISWLDLSRVNTEKHSGLSPLACADGTTEETRNIDTGICSSYTRKHVKKPSLKFNIAAAIKCLFYTLQGLRSIEFVLQLHFQFEIRGM
jgi:hypothetical protein